MRTLGELPDLCPKKQGFNLSSLSVITQDTAASLFCAFWFKRNSQKSTRSCCKQSKRQSVLIGLLSCEQLLKSFQSG